jgi:hypothetical protein
VPAGRFAAGVERGAKATDLLKPESGPEESDLFFAWRSAREVIELTVSEELGETRFEIVAILVIL